MTETRIVIFGEGGSDSDQAGLDGAGNDEVRQRIAVDGV